MPLTRTEHWATREFHDFLVDRREQPFVWGTNDCCLFPADAILAFTGVDIADDFRGKYSSEEEAWALVASVTGGTTVADAAAWCAAKHGLVELAHPMMAQRGDLVVIENEGRQIAGIVNLTGRHVVSVGDGGMVRLLITTNPIQRAWRV
jgi:hypothetical protein